MIRLVGIIVVGLMNASIRCFIAFIPVVETIYSSRRVDLFQSRPRYHPLCSLSDPLHFPYFLLSLLYLFLFLSFRCTTICCQSLLFKSGLYVCNPSSLHLSFSSFFLCSSFSSFTSSFFSSFSITFSFDLSSKLNHLLISF